jgi:hypothetical protein
VDCPAELGLFLLVDRVVHFRQRIKNGFAPFRTSGRNVPVRTMPKGEFSRFTGGTIDRRTVTATTRRGLKLGSPSSRILVVRSRPGQILARGAASLRCSRPRQSWRRAPYSWIFGHVATGELATACVTMALLDAAFPVPMDIASNGTLPIYDRTIRHDSAAAERIRGYRRQCRSCCPMRHRIDLQGPRNDQASLASQDMCGPS